MTSDHERFMRVALEEAKRVKAEGNEAIGSIIVRGGEVIARGRNLVRSTSDPTAHAETVAIREAGAATSQTDFSGCTLYTTWEPCPMCCGAILNSGISTLVMGARSTPAEARFPGYSVERLLEMLGWADKLQVVTGVLVDECRAIR